MSCPARRITQNHLHQLRDDVVQLAGLRVAAAPREADPGLAQRARSARAVLRRCYR